MTFSNWTSDIHKDIDQIVRLDNSLKIKPESIVLNHDTNTAIISGSNDYEVSLTNCTCMDFSIRNLPCKHIYRLALELGLINPPKINPDEAKKFAESIPSEIKRYEILYETGAISGKKYAAIVKALQSK